MKKRKNKSKKFQKKQLEYRCESCNAKLSLEGGYYGTGLCGVCATGESALLEEYGETW
ncbi:MAG: hypothetical protein AAFW70_01075 [Cyanobacteria bacterium J06635_10]